MKKLIALLAVIFILPILAQAKMGGDPVLEWEASSSSDVASYSIYWIEADEGWGSPDVHIKNVGNVTEYPIRSLGVPEGVELMFTVTAFDDVGNECGKCEEQPREEFDFTPPVPPGWCRIRSE